MIQFGRRLSFAVFVLCNTALPEISFSSKFSLFPQHREAVHRISGADY
jgi:hypothetical protein